MQNILNDFFPPLNYWSVSSQEFKYTGIYDNQTQIETQTRTYNTLYLI